MPQIGPGHDERKVGQIDRGNCPDDRAELPMSPGFISTTWGLDGDNKDVYLSNTAKTKVFSF
jgi:inorganic pyrophosphatase